MSAPALDSKLANLRALLALAGQLERLERGISALAADQYRELVQRLGRALDAELPAGALEAVLGLHPATAELYENLQYAHAGLCRSPLDAAVRAETAAREALARLQRRVS